MIFKVSLPFEAPLKPRIQAHSKNIMTTAQL